MTTADFETLLARQCAPTFTGLKAASLVSFQKDRFDDFDAQLADYEPCFACHGISVFRLLDEDNRALVLFYRADVLGTILRRRGARMLNIGNQKAKVESCCRNLSLYRPPQQNCWECP